MFQNVMNASDTPTFTEFGLEIQVPLSSGGLLEAQMFCDDLIEQLELDCDVALDERDESELGVRLIFVITGEFAAMQATAKARQLLAQALYLGEDGATLRCVDYAL